MNGEVHTNGLENFWSLLKRAMKGTYVRSSRSTWSATSTNRLPLQPPQGDRGAAFWNAPDHR